MSSGSLRDQLSAALQSLNETHLKLIRRSNAWGDILAKDKPTLHAGRDLMSEAETRAYRNNVGWTFDNDTITCKIPKGMVPRAKMPEGSAAEPGFSELSNEFLEHMRTQHVSQFWQLYFGSKKWVDPETACTFGGLKHDVADNMVVVETRTLGGHETRVRERTKTPQWKSSAYDEVVGLLPGFFNSNRPTDILRLPACDAGSQYRFELRTPVPGTQTTGIPNFTRETFEAILKDKQDAIDLLEQKLGRSAVEKLEEAEKQTLEEEKEILENNLTAFLSKYGDDIILPDGGLDGRKLYRSTNASVPQTLYDPNSTQDTRLKLAREPQNSTTGKEHVNPLRLEFQIVDSDYNHEEAVFTEARSLIKGLKSKQPTLDWSEVDSAYKIIDSVLAGTAA